MEISASGMGREQSKLCPASYVLLPRSDTIASAFVSLAKTSQWSLLSPARSEGAILLRGTEPWERKLKYSVNRSTINESDYKRRDADTITGVSNKEQ